RAATLPLNPFEISDQQQAKIPPRRQRRTPHRLRVEALTLPLYKLVEPTLLQQLVQPLVERMCHRPRPLRVGNPKLFLRLPLLRSSSHRHARSLRTSALDYARNFTSESRLSPRTARPKELIGRSRIPHRRDVRIAESWPSVRSNRWLVERLHRRVIQVRFPESWSSTFSGEKAVLTHRPGYFCLANAFALIEGHPAPALVDRKCHAVGSLARRVAAAAIGTAWGAAARVGHRDLRRASSGNVCSGDDHAKRVRHRVGCVGLRRSVPIHYCVPVKVAAGDRQHEIRTTVHLAGRHDCRNDRNNAGLCHLFRAAVPAAKGCQS